MRRVSELGLGDAFDSGLRRVSPALIEKLDAAKGEQIIRPPYWNLCHEIALWAFHPAASRLRDDQVHPLIALQAINIELGGSNDPFMGRFVGFFLAKLAGRHRSEKADANHSEHGQKLAELSAENLAIAELGIRNTTEIQNELADSYVASQSMFTRLDRDALCALARGPFKTCYEWEKLVNIGAPAVLHAEEITTIQRVLSDILSGSSLPRSVSRLYLDTTLGLYVWGNGWSQDQSIIGLDPRERLLRSTRVPRGHELGEFLLRSLPTVAELYLHLYSSAQGRARYSGKVGEARFLRDAHVQFNWIEALRIHPDILLKCFDRARTINPKASLETAAVMAFCCSVDRCDTDLDDFAALLVPELVGDGSNEPAVAVLKSGLLTDLARFGVNQAVQKALNEARNLSLVSKLPQVIQGFLSELNGRNEVIQPSVSLITDRVSSSDAELEQALERVQVDLGHQYDLGYSVYMILQNLRQRSNGVDAGRYLESVGDIVRFADVFMRREKKEVGTLDGLEPDGVTVVNDINNCVRVAHRWIEHFGPVVLPNILGIVFTEDAGVDLRTRYPRQFSGDKRPEFSDIYQMFCSGRKRLVIAHRGKWPLEMAQTSGYSISVNSELLLSAICPSPNTFRSVVTDSLYASVLRNGGQSLSLDFFLPDLLPLPYRIDETKAKLEEAIPDASFHRYLGRHVRWLQLYGANPKPKVELSNGQCSLAPILADRENVEPLFVRSGQQGEGLKDVFAAAAVLLNEINPYVLEDPSLSASQAFERVKASLAELVRVQSEKIGGPRPRAETVFKKADLLDKQALDFEQAKGAGELLRAMARTSFRSVNRNTIPHIRTWLSALVPEGERQNISAQGSSAEEVRRGIVRSVAWLDSVVNSLNGSLASIEDQKRAEELVGLVFPVKKISEIHLALQKKEGSSFARMVMYPSAAYELSAAGMIADTCAISELHPQESNANIATVPFILPDAPLWSPMFMGSANIFGVVLEDGSSSILVRPLNPSDFYLDRFYVEDVVEGLFTFLEARVKRAGDRARHFTSVTIPWEERSGGILSNRPDVVAYLKERYFSKADEGPEVRLADPNAAVYRGVPIPGRLKVVRRWSFD